MFFRHLWYNIFPMIDSASCFGAVPGATSLLWGGGDP
ncbi:hypothetical protein BACCAP_01930 [Pseudoflavonifractor capillosus ATCC 29799]|uniref:Uncharacterized protein n=1 Tax=Pseudoflavonifractor capillosus ATCC 29799 TaxID=411467 RepID=A6NUP6_9FIRM|nr:hypothetical protein BACCAP_01930 [Pseudoflavonifractor capillosus ATCC 29799]